MVKSLSELEKSHSWRFGPQRSETFSRVAELRVLRIFAALLLFVCSYALQERMLSFSQSFPVCLFLSRHLLADKGLAGGEIGGKDGGKEKEYPKIRNCMISLLN